MVLLHSASYRTCTGSKENTHAEPAECGDQARGLKPTVRVKGVEVLVMLLGPVTEVCVLNAAPGSAMWAPPTLHCLEQLLDSCSLFALM